MGAANQILLPIIPLLDKEPLLTWEDYCRDPLKLFNEFANRFGVDAQLIKDATTIFKSDNIPPPDQRGKIWVKTSWPYAMAVVIDGQYKYDYGLCSLPVKTPFLYKESDFDPVPALVHKLTSQEITDYGLVDTIGTDDERRTWWIFEPEDPEF